jgi:hypothetical protein
MRHWYAFGSQIRNPFSTSVFKDIVKPAGRSLAKRI